MKQIGIITHYYGSKNYGGVLQSYALCQFLKNQGFDAEQIQFDKDKGESIKRRLGKAYRYTLSIPRRIKYRRLYKEIRGREVKFAAFRDGAICHSKEVFTQDSLNRLAKEYQLYITGSDQVWHPNAVCDAYLLDFGIEGIKKMSYAASIAKDTLSAEESGRYKKAFKDYAAISVREKSAVELLRPITPVEIQWVVDPVFLLRREEWKSLVGSKCDSERYALCYFLGNDSTERKIAKEYAKCKNLKLKVMPFLNGEISEDDLDYGDERIINASPSEFVQLIQSAEIVFTDSFHATAFSLLFERQFYVFERSFQSSMGSRIESLTELFSVQDHYCNIPNRTTFDYIYETASIDYSKEFTAFETMRKSSISYLLSNINKILEEVK